MAAGAAALTALISCTGASQDAGQRRDLVGYAQSSCGPADGPAVELYVTDTMPSGAPRLWLDSIARIRGPHPDSVVTPGEPNVLRVLIWESVSRLPGRRFEVASERPPWGDATLCDARSCMPLEAGSIRFEHWDGDLLQGRYEIRAGGLTKTGRFRAQWVEQVFLCG